MEANETAAAFLQAIPKMTQLPQEKQMEVLWYVVGGLLADTAHLAAAHEAMTVAIGQYVEAVDKCSMKRQEALKLMQHMEQQLAAEPTQSSDGKR